MRDRLDDLLREATLVTLAFGIALGWSLFEVARGVASTVSTLLVDVGTERTDFERYEPLTWHVGNRVLTFHQLLEGLVELLVVLLVALFVRVRTGAPRR